MIIVNYYQSEDYNPSSDGYTLTLAAVVNDELDLQCDIDLITDCIDNDTSFKPQNGVLYEIQLDRATIASDPVPEPAFAISKVITKRYDLDLGWCTPIVRL